MQIAADQLHSTLRCRFLSTSAEVFFEARRCFRQAFTPRCVDKVPDLLFEAEQLSLPRHEDRFRACFIGGDGLERGARRQNSWLHFQFNGRSVAPISQLINPSHELGGRPRPKTAALHWPFFFRQFQCILSGLAKMTPSAR
jgi:hypothetical protein